MRQFLHLYIIILCCLTVHSALADKTPIRSSGGVYVVMPDQLRAIFDKGSILVQGESESEMWKLAPAQSHNHFGLQLSSPMSSDQQSSSGTWSSIHKILIDDAEAKIIVVLDDDYTPYIDPLDKESKRGYVGIAFIYCDGSDSRKLPGRAFMKLKLSEEGTTDQPEEPIMKEATTSTSSAKDAAGKPTTDPKKEKDTPQQKDQKDKGAKKDDKSKKDTSASTSSSTSTTPARNSALANSLLTGTADKTSVLGALRGKKK